MKKELKNILKITSEPYMRILPGNLAFSFMIALVPIISLLIYIFGIFNLQNNILGNFDAIIPETIINMLNQLLETKTFNSTLFILGLWAASSGIDALIIASNIIYKVPEESYVKRKIKAFLLTFLIIIIIVINLIILVFGDLLLKTMIDMFSLNKYILSIFSFLKWPISLVIIFIILKIIYTIVPSKPIKSRCVTKGALITTIFWVCSSACYSLYVNYTNIYNIKYGSFANIIILLLWLYILSYILMIGTSINANEYDKFTK